LANILIGIVPFSRPQRMFTERQCWVLGNSSVYPDSRVRFDTGRVGDRRLSTRLLGGGLHYRGGRGCRSWSVRVHSR